MSRPAGREGVWVARLFVSLALCVFAPLPLWAQTTWTNPGADDWYLATNWSGATVPTSVDNVQINNGGEAAADRGSVLYTADPQTAALAVGIRTSPMAAPPESTGSLTLIDVDLDASGPVTVGMVDTSAGAFLEATGTLDAQAGPNASGDLHVNGDRKTGYLLNGPDDARARGYVDLSGSLAGNDAGTVEVGYSNDAGSGEGTLQVDGDLSGFQKIAIGSAGTDATWQAAGHLAVSGSILRSLAATSAKVLLSELVGRAGEYRNGSELVSHLESPETGMGTLTAQPGTTPDGQPSVGVGASGVAVGGEFAVALTDGPADVSADVQNIGGTIAGYSDISIAHVGTGATGDASALIEGGSFRSAWTPDLNPK